MRKTSDVDRPPAQNLPPKRGTHRARKPAAAAPADLVGSLTVTVAAASWLKPTDQTAVDLAFTYARRIDSAIATGEGQEVTKALYLGPHLLNTLRELGLTPGARKDLDIEGEVSGKLSDLRKRASLTSINGGKASARK